MIDSDTVWEAGGTEGKTSAGSVRRYRKPLKSFRWCDLKALFSDTVNEWYKHKAQRLGASPAFYTLLSLAPLVVIVALAGAVYGHEAARGQIVAPVSGLMGCKGWGAIKVAIKQATAHSRTACNPGWPDHNLFFGAAGVVVISNTFGRERYNAVHESPSCEHARDLVGSL